MLRNFNMVCILSDVNKIDPNLAFSSSRTPSVCQYKHQSLVIVELIVRMLIKQPYLIVTTKFMSAPYILLTYSSGNATMHWH